MKERVKYILSVMVLSMVCVMLQAQDKNLIQIKAFDQQLAPLTHIKVSINEKEYISLENKGGTFREVPNEDLPPRSVKINDETLEAESWNYSKGILSIMVRKKSYKSQPITVMTMDHKPLPRVTVTFHGAKNTESITNAQGIFILPLALNEEAPQATQFAIAGYKVMQMTSSKEGKILLVESLKKNKILPAENVAQKDILADFDINQLDSIRSLTVFYAVFKNIEIASLPFDQKERVDAKFQQLVRQLKNEQKTSFVGKISDSSFVRTDVENLLAQARYENDLLDNLRSDFEKKIGIINEKLTGGASSLDQATRDRLLDDLNTLEHVLTENEDKFYKNLSSYKIILSSLKSSFFDIQNLEQKLEVSESKRLEEQKTFRQQILIVVSITLVFGILVIFLFYLRMKLKKQQKSLIKANDEVTRMNENLEELVSERTRLLIHANREMDIFLYRASHDLRTPICSIMGLCNIALHSSSAELPELVKRMSYTAVRMDRMLKKLRVINEINQPGNYSIIRFSEKIEFLRQEFSQVIGDHAIDISFDFEPDLSFYSYPALIDTIVYNLLDNAFFYSSLKPGSQPKVYLQARIERDNLVMRIRDNGVGIIPEIQMNLWDMFFVGSEHSKGNGLGLYLVSKSIQTLGGSIDIDTQPNVFTTFTVSIPVNTERVTRIASEAQKTTMLELV